MALSERQMLDALSRTPFVDLTELAGILGEPHATVHRTLSNLLAEGIVGRVNHGTAHLPSSQRYHLTAGATITSDAGLLACRELDDALGLTEEEEECLQESRGGRNVQHRLVGLLRQSVYSRRDDWPIDPGD